MIIEILEKINTYNEMVSSLILKLVQILHVPEFLQEAFVDSINLIPYLFLIFLFIEIFENYFSEKIEKLSLCSRQWGPVIGSLLASIPQCGFSVIATMLYVKKFITTGTLISVYIATSDEAIPIMLVHPEKFSVIFPIIGLKIILGIIAGYLIDFIFKPKNLMQTTSKDIELDIEECGCCHNEIHSQVTNLFIHPLKHTFNIFIFILIVTCILDYSLTLASGGIAKLFSVNVYAQPIVASIVGLIPNCATSVLVVLLYLNNVLNFGAMIAGLSTNAGLGLLVLFKHNETLKDSLKIVAILLVIAIISGELLQLF